LALHREDERRIVGLIRRATRFGLDDLALVLRHFLPHLNRASIYRILKAEGLHRLADLPPLHATRTGRGAAPAGSGTMISASCPWT
jgi:hypothetical protein